MTRAGNESDELILMLPELLAATLPGYLPEQRWFGDKARTISRVSLRAALPLEGIDVPAALCVVNVAFTSGADTSYTLPVALVGDPADRTFIAQADTGNRTGWLIDATTLEGFGDWLLRTLTADEPIALPGGRFEVDTLPTGRTFLTSLTDARSRELGIDQSNTAIAYGFDALVKLFRRLQPGTNPDVELTRFLSAKTSFRQIPAYLGAITFVPDSGEREVLAVAQRFVENDGNGWNFVLAALRSSIEQRDTAALHTNAAATGRRLGEITGEMHLALASDPWTPALAPETIKRDDAARWTSDYLAMLRRVVAGIGDRIDRLEGETRALAESFLAIAPGLEERAHGFERLIGRAKTRVHGDYHLGQTLRTPDGDFVVLDFEGEPQRGIEERRQKTSPLKDVAGMLRSFSYARGTATAWLHEERGLLPSDLVGWERTVRAEFVQAYTETVRHGGGAFLPQSPEDTNAALSAWELDKAAYEVLYELNNRPDWLWIPLSAMLKQGEPAGGIV